MNPIAMVERVFREVFDDEGLIITSETGPDDVPGWDSVAQVKIVLALESELGFRFDTDDVFPVERVGDLLEAIARHRSG